MTEYLVIFEKAEEGWGAYVPDLPGCVAAGATREEVERLMREAIPFHLEGNARGRRADPRAGLLGWVRGGLSRKRSS